MPTLKVLAPAKINLTFDIKGRLPDDYHEVETLLQAVDLFDHLTFDIEPGPSLKVEVRLTNERRPPLFPLDQTNLIVHAARLFFQQAHLSDSARIVVTVEKSIPIGSGLAGGSSNAAATLVALNQAFGQPFGADKLVGLARRLGADVPFCIDGGTQIGRGRGDILTPLTAGQTLFFCLVKPRRLTISTPWAYHEFDKEGGSSEKLDTDRAAKAVEEGDLEAAVKAFGNSFESLILAKYPELAQLKQKLLDLGCYCCHLSGSGPALYAIVGDREMAHYVRRKVLGNDDDGFEYGSNHATDEFGPPIDFFIGESIAHGVKVLEPSPVS